MVADLLQKNVDVHRRTIGQYIDHNKRGVKYRQESVLERIVVPIVEPLYAELQHFLDCVAEGKTPLVTARDGLKALNLATQICDTVQKRLLVREYAELPQP